MSASPRTIGLLAQFESPEDLLRAASTLRNAGYSNVDAFSPFPIHGMDAALDNRPTRLPWLVFLAGLAGGAGGLLLQWWINAVDYPFLVSGKPIFSLPANIPITFETTILFAAIAAFVGMLALNRLPRQYNPLFRAERFRKASTDGFFILVKASDPLFDETSTRTFLEEISAKNIVKLDEDAGEQGIPRPIIAVALLLAALALVPVALVLNARVSGSSKPRIHLIKDMDWQPKYKAQARNNFFPDGRAMRKPVTGTITRDDPFQDTPFYSGKRGGSWLTTLPIPATRALAQRGRERFNVFCATCHGLSGYGDGMVARRAASIAEKATNPEDVKWVPPASLHSDAVHSMPDGRLFDVITHGVRTMPAYGSQVPPRDKWAIVLYIRALQRSQRSTLKDVPPEARSLLEAGKKP